MPPGPAGGGLEFTLNGCDLSTSSIIGYVPRTIENGVQVYAPITRETAALQWVENNFFRSWKIGANLADAICEGYIATMRPTFDMSKNHIARKMLNFAYDSTGLVAQLLMHAKFGFGERYEQELMNAYDNMITSAQFANEFRSGKAASTVNVNGPNGRLYEGAWITQKLPAPLQSVYAI